jgi:hypothetical protein
MFASIVDLRAPQSANFGCAPKRGIDGAYDWTSSVESAVFFQIEYLGVLSREVFVAGFSSGRRAAGRFPLGSHNRSVRP